jgi:expansin (peptidoglycan-binding protein)
MAESRFDNDMHGASTLVATASIIHRPLACSRSVETNFHQHASYFLSTFCTCRLAVDKKARAASPTAEDYSDDKEPRVTKSESLATSFASRITDFTNAVAPWIDGDTHTGDGTAFSDAVNNTGSGFACSFRYLNDRFSRYFAAINSEQWEDGAACGRCVVARCVDPLCEVQNEDVLVQIVDLCPECKKGDVDFSFPAYRAVTGLWPHRLQIKWEWASCAPEIDGTIQFDSKDGSTAHWQAFFLANQRYPIKKAMLNGVELMRSPYRFFIHAGMAPECPCELELTADTGAVVKATVADLFGKQDLKVQFPIGM